MGGLLRRIGRWIRTILSIFVEGLEETVPLERRLAYDRQEKAGNLKKMVDKATDVGEAAELMVQALAEARIIESNLREEALGHLQSAKAAASRGDTTTEESEHAAAAALADDLAEAEKERKELETTVTEALKDKKDAQQMVLDQALELQRLAKHDARLVARVRIAEMREESLRLREAMLQLIPQDQENIRQRVFEQARKREARVKSRTEIVNKLWKQKRRGMIDRRMQVTARGAQILRQLETQADYKPAKEMPAPAEATDEEIRRKAAVAEK